MEYNITYREKDKGWQFIISQKDENGKWKQVKSKQGFGKKAEAKKVADKLVDELKEKWELEKTVSTEFRGITFGKFVEGYLEDYKLNNTPKTLESYDNTMKKFSDLKPIELTKVTTMDIQKAVNKMREEGIKVSSIKFYLSKINAIFNSAIEKHEIMKRNPIKMISLGNDEGETIEKTALTESESNKLLEAFKGTKYYLILYMALNTGMRIGELMGLTVGVIDFKNCKIKVDKQWQQDKQGTWGFAPVKTKRSNRIIPISSKVSKEIARNITVIGIDSRVFPWGSTHAMDKVLNNAMESKGFKITMHELRHTYATKLVASNKIDWKTIATILGHDVKVTMATYSHVNADMMDNAQIQMESIF